ncbi:hypothetical protein CC86DRAFT_400686 [Ophiobolus disseminans]|uniref:LysM domain-containing protein n=1 Tax=Ophiobolus disseminans TaxID=1469910 RepID=A0A6A7AF19_9PLEO|nr:hypothetical protein CC86DRAFT_400686 [Ophiobolus disseminans]
MKFSSTLLLLSSILTVFTHPLTDKSESGYNTTSCNPSALAPRASKTQHGTCNLWLELIELLPRRIPIQADIQMHITDNQRNLLTSPKWSSGHPIAERQILDATIRLNDVIEPGSELRINWTNVGERQSRRKDPGLDWL